jgi:hypothetical protein
MQELGNPGQRQNLDLGCLGFEQDARALGQRGARGHDIVHDQDPATLGPLRPLHGKRPGHDSPPGRGRLPPQRRRIANSAQAGGKHNWPGRWPARKLFRHAQEIQCLVESSLTQTTGVQGDRAQRVHTAVERSRDGRREQGAQGSRQVATPPVFQVKNRLGRGAPVGQHRPNPREGKRLGLAALAATVPAAAPVYMRQGQAAASTSMVHCRDRKRTALTEWPVFRDKGVAGSATCGPEKPSRKLKQHATLSAALGLGCVSARLAFSH